MPLHNDRPRRPNHTGRSEKASRFTRLPHDVWLSEGFASLNVTARALLFELAGMENGKNNGSLWLSTRDAKDRLGLASEKPAVQAFQDLIAANLIEVSKDAHFAVKVAYTSRARCWRLMWLPWPDCPKKPRRIAQVAFKTFSMPTDYDEKSRKRIRKRIELRQKALSRYRRDTSSGKMPAVNFTVISDF